jgi:hypothetical protein
VDRNDALEAGNRIVPEDDLFVAPITYGIEYTQGGLLSEAATRVG